MPEAVHRERIGEQRERYEERLFSAERARLDCEAAAERARSGAAATIRNLAQRVERLERAAQRSRARAPGGPAPGALARVVRKALGAASSSAMGRDAVQWQVAVADWFDAGSARLRPDAIEPLARLAQLLAERPRLTVQVRLLRPPSVAPEVVEPGWRETAERGVAILAALQAQGVAAARLTLAIGGAGPEGRIVFSIRSGSPDPT